MKVYGEQDSYFDGGYFAYFGQHFLLYFVSTITLGIAYPWMRCMVQRWKARHTVINGKRTCFDGTGGQLIGKFILWWFLSIITFGIYSWWMRISIKKWLTKHTHFQGVEGGESYFDGGVLGFFGINIVTWLLTFVPLVGPAWGDVIRLRWEIRHTVVDSDRLCYTGGVWGLFGKYFLWGFLTVITFGIFSFFRPVKRLRWQVGHTIIQNEPVKGKSLAGPIIVGIIFAVVLTFGAALAATSLNVSIPMQIPNAIEDLAFETATHGTMKMPEMFETE